MKLKKNLYLPIEIKVREIPHKVYLSYEALKKNYRIYIGSKSDLFQLIAQKKSRGGIFMAKGSISSTTIDLIKKKCDVFCIFDEEMNRSMQNYVPGLSMLDFYKYMLKTRLTSINIKHLDKYYCFNNHILKSAKIILNKKKNILLPGHLKEDLLKKKNLLIFERNRKKIKSKYGEFILFNSDFLALYDPDFHISYNEKMLKESNISKKITKIDVKNVATQIKYKHRNFLYFMNFLEKIKNKMKNLKMIIRPHPREDIDYWKKITKNFNNIEIVNPIDDVTPYILASKGVMHNGCSTAISSLIIGKPTAYFINKDDISNETHIQKDILKSCIEVNNPDDFDKWLISIKKNSKKYLKKNKYIVGFNKMNLSSEIILKDFDKDKVNLEPKIESTKIEKKNKFYRLTKYLLSEKLSLKNIWKNSYKMPIKIPGGIKKQEVEKYLRGFEKIYGTNNKAKVRQLSDNLIEIS